MKKDGVKTAIKVLPTGVDKIPGSKKEAASFRLKNGVEPEEKLILYAGRLGAEKNLDLLIESFFEVAGQNEHVKLMFVGDFSYKPVLEKMARSSGLNNRIIFTGRMPRASLGSVYMAADIFAFPSLTDTQALVLNEAAHAGLPIVWCDKYLNKVAVHGKNGICAEPNAASFTKALNELITNDEKRRKFGLRSKVEAKKFGEAKMTKKLIRELEAL
jgi:glycosyltransferase involved in cell wall biosynthesis